MALTLDIVDRNLTGHRREVVVDFTFDSSYATGGEALTPENLGLSSIESFQVVESPDGYAYSYDRSTEKLLAFRADNDAVADGPLIEVANAVDLSAANGRAIARGR